MKTFFQFLAENIFRDVKTMVMNCIGANIDDRTAWDSPLSNFQKTPNILRDQSLKALIDAHPNKGEIERLVSAAGTNKATVGELIRLIAADSSPDGPDGQSAPI